ncbi:MAG TPA: pyridoxamine 5'-phosphate oxidase family protein [Acidimicrobiia bacterium]|nr:pyridoxamine 5'-phosphate oxidase family protein [Acidimicrobiia bacterium]
MDRHEVRQELDQPAAQQLLQHAGLARLAYNGPDGLPRVVPVGFLWNGENVVVCTGTTAPKVRAISERPEVALTIDVGDTPDGAKALLMRGVATVDIVDGVADEYLAMSRKGLAEELGEEGFAEFERQVRATYDAMARISVEPRWARLYDFGAGRLPAYLADLVANAAQNQ